MSGFNFNFNLENFGMGVIAGWASAYALYRARHLLSAAQESVSRQASTAQEFAVRSADKRYTQDLTKYSLAAHLFGESVRLSQIVVEPRFVKPAPLAAPPDDDVVRTVFHVVPNIADHPYLQAPYNIETMSIEELGRGDRAVALLGIPGSGKTTALHTIALWSLGEVRFDPPPDQVQQRFQEEERRLDENERAEMIKQRVEIEQLRARSQESGDETVVRQSTFRQLTPIYVHLANVRLNTGEFGRRIDPAEPLLRAAQQYVSRVTSKTMPRNVYERMNEGKALLLLDGYEDLPLDEQKRKVVWFKALMEQYPDNFYIVTGPEYGYGDLIRTGFAPVFIRPLHDNQINSLVDKFVEVWPQLRKSRRRGDHTPDEAAISEVRQNSRAMSVFDLNVKMWGAFNNSQEQSPESWIRSLLAYYLPNAPMGTTLPQLALAARLQLETGYITLAGLDTISRGEPVASVTDTAPDETELAANLDDDASFLDDAESGGLNPFIGLDDTDDDEAFLSELEAVDDSEVEELFDTDTTTEAHSGTSDDSVQAAAATPESKKGSKEFARLLSMLHKSGLITYFRGGRFQFRHSLITAYLGSLAFREMSAVEQQEKVLDPAWRYAVAFSAMHTPLDSLVEQQLNSSGDILHDNVLEVAHWLGHSGGEVAWKKRLLSLLGNMLVAPDQFLLNRERAAAALVTARDESALRVFVRGMDHANPHVRRLSCLGVGAYQEPRALNKLADLMGDPDSDVTVAAALALGAIGTEDALEEITFALTAGSEILRQAVAETFAAIPDTGYPTLYEAAQHEEMMVRRAAVFGLRRVNTPWALISLYQRSVDDKQFYVKAAAEAAFQQILFGDQASGAKQYPPIEDIPWLREWIMELGPEAMQEETPENYLRIIAQGGSGILRQLALTVIGQLGLLTQAGVLYESLGDNDGTIRETAHRALADIQMQIGAPLPSPV